MRRNLVTITMEENLLEALRVESARRGCNRSELVRACCREFLAREGAGKPVRVLKTGCKAPPRGARND